MTKRMIIAFLLLLLVFGGIFGYIGYGMYQGMQQFASFAPPPVTVSATEARLEEWQPTIRSVGKLSAVNGVLVSAEVAGRVERIAFESGSTVKKGEMLLQMDDSSEQAELPGLRARVKLAKQNLDRMEQLVKQNLTSGEQLDAAQSEFDQARSALAAREAIIDKKRIVAPFAGELGIRKVDVGEYLQPGQEIVSLQALDSLFIDFTLPEHYIGQVRRGMIVNIQTNAYPGEHFSGEITAISADVDPNSHNFSVQARIPNLDQRLRPGLFADIRILAGDPVERVTIPRTAVTFTLYGDSVYVITPAEDGSETLQVEQRFVQLGEERENDVAIVKGVSAGERVVTAGQLKLNAGSRVVVDNEVALD